MIPRSTFTVEVYEYGIGIRGIGMPADLLPMLTAAGEARGYDVLGIGVAAAMGLLFFISDADGIKAATAEIEAGLVGLGPLDRWLAGTDTGTSSLTIVQAVTGRQVLDRRASVPYEPADFGRCHRLLEAVPDLRARLGEVADRYPAWGPLVANWDELTALYLEELPSGRAPRLYERMQQLLGVTE